MVNSEKFAKRLEKILEFYGLSATAFADTIDFNRSTISHLLSGRNKPSLDFVMKVIENFPEVELYWLLNGKGSFPSENSSGTKSPASNNDENLFPQQQSKNSDAPETSIAKLQKEVIPVKLGEIERIVVFFKDGTFKAYENE